MGTIAGLRKPHARTRAATTITLMVALAVPSLSSCTPHDAGGDPSPPVAGEPVMLAITGYNYTNRSIGSFSVNGQGGGNIFVSTPTSGGGGRACCVLYEPGSPVPKVTVRWQTGGCYYHKKKVEYSGQVYDALYPFFEEREVAVAGPIPSHPEVLEVHFYPGGEVQAAITAEASDPRLHLDSTREDKSRYPRCPNDQKPAE